jgi:nucleoside-diphosphate-sugar epimerase
MSEDAKRRALVTGGTGFIGSHLVRLLVEEGWEVHAVVRPASDCSSLPAAVVRHVDDGSHSTLEQAVRQAVPSTCFHLAGQFLGTHQPEDVSSLVAANVGFGARLSEALSTRPGTLLINAGTYWQHVNSEPYHPAALYAAMKQALEDILRYYADAELVRVVTLNLYDTYGPADTRAKLLNLLLDAASTGEPLDTTGGDQLIDLLHVHDVARAFVTAANQFEDSPAPLFESYAVTSGTPISVRDLAAKVAAITGRTIDARWGARPYRRYEMFEPWEVGPRMPGWRPKMSLEAGIGSMWQSRNRTPVSSRGVTAAP